MSQNMNKKITLDWKEYIKTARQAVAEGNVLLRNEKKTLPLAKGSKVAIFGRIQFHYFKSGTGSGGLVNVDKVVGIYDALKESGHVIINEKLTEEYLNWEKENPIDEGLGWGKEPWSQAEMPLSDALVKEVAEKTEVALVVIGRTAGEDRDNKDQKGAYSLSEAEEEMLQKVRSNFKSMVVILNVGNIIDMSFVEEYQPEAVLYAWQGGMIGGYGTADVLTGAVNPSGCLVDTIAKSIKDYPSTKNFGTGKEDIYQEDIYVGYRYFETIGSDRVLYPFGFGLSYTEFSILPEKFVVNEDKETVQIEVNITNSGTKSGKRAVQIYVNHSQEKLGNPTRSLCAFSKTRELLPGENQVIKFEIPFYAFASYDDSGVTGYKSSYVLEQGKLEFYVGEDVRRNQLAGTFTVKETIMLCKLREALSPVQEYERLKPVGKETTLTFGMENVPTRTYSMQERRLAELPNVLPECKEDISLVDVYNKKATLEEFVATLSEEELSCIVRGEGMGSPKVTAGTASAFGGVSESLKQKKIPCGCCDDGPSGMRLDCGTKAFSLPNGTLLACTFNEELTEELFYLTGLEMVKNKVECLLGPGMNIHRNPLNGRNFEYFSEDPLITGKIAAAQLRGMKKAGVTGTIKHFAANNRETKRSEMNSVVSERALREIYLKGFEIAVREGKADSVMTTYGSLNGLWTAGNYDLNTTILRNEWGFKGIVMTDWWAKINREGKEPVNFDFASMVASQNDLYMVCSDGAVNNGDNTLEELKNGYVKLSELQRSAMNICSFLLTSQAFYRLLGEETLVEIVNRESQDDVNADEIKYFAVEDETTIDLSNINTKKGESYLFGLDLAHLGGYKFSFTAISDAGELAQMPVTLSLGNIPTISYNYNGTAGQWETQAKRAITTSKYTLVKVYFAQSGLQVRDLVVTFEKDITVIGDVIAYMTDEK